ncbi:MAG: PTS transporter subunit EIIC [Lachnospiraceae bacterium]|nr:PTS transporter subunit EIIC [Lachnospiraceae bacterium]
MEYQEEAKKIISLVGGEENIRSLVHCATRLRFDLTDEGKADKEALTGLSYVLQVVSSGGQYQVVIGPAVADYFNAIMSLVHFGAPKAGEGETKKANLLSAALKIISGAFSPLIPLLAGSGMMKAVLTVLVQAGLLAESSSTYLILAAASNAAFYFLPVFLGLTISKQLGANTYVGGAIGAALLEPNFTGLMAAEGAVTFLGIGVTPIDYASTIFPIFIAAMIYSVLEKGLKKIVKQELQLFLVPMICLMVMIPFTVIVFGPFGTIVANSVSSAVMTLFSFNRLIAGAVLGAAYPYLTMLGLHWGFSPITLQNLELYGGDIIEGVTVCSVFAQTGITAGLYLKGKKHSKIREVAGPTLITGVFAGITEPILYGLIMGHKRLMVIVALAGALGGAIAGLFQVMLTAFVFHNIFSTVTMAYSPFLPYLVGIAVSFVCGAVMTWLWGVPAGERADFEPASESAEPAAVKTAAGETVLEMRAPLSGEVIPLEQVEDEVFASGVTGLGLAIRPADSVVLSPCDGEISMIADSLHAIGIAAAGDAEVLIHVGLNTTMLGGKGFEPLVKKGDIVKTGQPLLKFDMDFIKSKGYPLVTPVLIVNAEDFEELELIAKASVKTGEPIYNVKQ